MSDPLIVNGVTFTVADFGDGGYLDDIVVNGITYARFLGLFAAAMNDIGNGLLTTATSSHNPGTMVAGDAVTVTLVTNRPYGLGASVLVAYSATVFFTMRVTVTCSGTSLVGTVISATGSGAQTAWTVQIAGERGATGTAALEWGGIKTANFAIMPGYEYVADCTSGAIIGTPNASWIAGQKAAVWKDGTGGAFTLAYSSVKINGGTTSDSTTVEGKIEMIYKNATKGLKTSGSAQ